MASVGAGIFIAAVFVTDQLLGPASGSRAFPFLHHTLTLNYTYRGMWGTLVITAVLFGVSYLTAPPTRRADRRDGRLRGAGSARRSWASPTGGLHWWVLAAITVFLYAWLW